MTDEIMDTFNDIKKLQSFIAFTTFHTQGQCRQYVVNELGKIKMNMRKRFNIIRVDEREEPKDDF